MSGFDRRNRCHRFENYITGLSLRKDGNACENGCGCRQDNSCRRGGLKQTGHSIFYLGGRIGQSRE